VDILNGLKVGLQGHVVDSRAGFQALRQGPVENDITPMSSQDTTETARPTGRYAKQVLFRGIGPEGQSRIGAARVFVAGCGALGSALADGLTRAGVGELRIIDRDIVDLTNLQRQVLYDEDDVASGLPKAIAAANKLRRINSTIRIDPIVGEIGPDNVLDLFREVDLVLDGLDNFETRFLLNDAALETGTPWIYAGCLGSHGQMLPIFPGRTACLRCLIDSPPEPGTGETCDTAGVIQPIISALTALQIATALRFLAGKGEAIEPALTLIDVWENTHRTLTVQRDDGCPACGRGERLWLRGERLSQSAVLCGRNAVQVTPSTRGKLDLVSLAERLSTSGVVSRNPFLVKFVPHGTEFELTIFGDGRALVKGTEEPVVARSVYTRYVGG
jgi:molybdopterin-synthase adenylyltransferase